MLDLRKLFARERRGRKGADEQADSDYHPSKPRGEGLEVEYQTLIAAQFRRWGIAPGCITIEVRRLGQAHDGFDVLVGMVRLAHWERDSALKVLLGLPMLESRVRKTVRASWLADFSHFGGLWLHASEQIHHEGASGELRRLLMDLVPPSPPSPGQDGSDIVPPYAASSVPPSTS